jgi:hypothetical protein
MVKLLFCPVQVQMLEAAKTKLEMQVVTIKKDHK